MPRTGTAKKATKKTKRSKLAEPVPHRSFRLTQKRPKNKNEAKLPSTWKLMKQTLGLLWRFKLTFLSLVFIHGVLVILLALDPAGNASYILNSTLLLIFSLAVIWVIRHANAGEKTTVREALYKGTAQLVPFLLLGLLLSIQLIPFAVGLWLFQVVVGGGIAIHMAEQAIFLVIMLALGLISWYWVATSAVALYIITLPDVTPMNAWHTAKRLVDGRRALIAGRLLILLLVSAIVAYLLVLPLPEIWLIEYNVLAVIGALILPLIHTFGYKLYRSLV